MDVIIRDDSRIKLLSYVLALTDYPQREQKRRPHAVHKILPETREQLSCYIDLPAVKQLVNLLNAGIPYFFIQAYVLSLDWPELEPHKFSPYIFEYCPEILETGFNELLSDFYQKANLNELWEKHHKYWEETCKDAEKCFEGIAFKSLLSSLFGKLDYNLVFSPNILVPQLTSTGPSSTTELFCVARMPGPVSPESSIMPFSRDCNWVKIVAFHEFCHPLMDELYRNNREMLERSKKIAERVEVFDEYRNSYPDWEDIFTEILIYSMTIVFLRQIVSRKAAEDFEEESREKTGIKLYSITADLIEEYLLEAGRGKYKTIADYFPIIIRKLAE